MPSNCRWLLQYWLMGPGVCGLVHKPLAYHAEARRSFPCGDNAESQTAEQTANKGCINVCIKSGTFKWTFHEPQKP